MVSHLCDNGLTDVEAAGLEGVYLIALAASKVVFGWLIDRIGVRKVTIICCLCAVVSMLFLPAVANYSQALPCMIIYGFAMPLTTIIVPALTIDLFGNNSYITAMGVFTAMVSGGRMLSGPISNVVFDHFGNYMLSFRVGAVVMLLMIVMLGIIYWRADKLKKQYNVDAPVTTLN